MKKVIKINYLAPVEEEIEVEGEFADFIREIERAEREEDDTRYYDLLDSQAMDKLTTKIMCNLDGELRLIRLTTDMGSCIWGDI